jgi:hypothetical protein
VTGLVGSAVALHVVLLVAMGNDVGGVVGATLIANMVLVILVTARAVIGWRDRPTATPTDETHQRTAEMAAVTSQDPDEAGQREHQRPDGDPHQDT